MQFGRRFAISMGSHLSSRPIVTCWKPQQSSRQVPVCPALQPSRLQSKSRTQRLLMLSDACCCLPLLARLALRLTTSPARLLLMDAATPLAVSQCHAWQILRPKPCKLGFCAALVPEAFCGPRLTRTFPSTSVHFNLFLHCTLYRIPVAISSFLILVIFPRLPNFESFDRPRSVLHTEDRADTQRVRAARLCR